MPQPAKGTRLWLEPEERDASGKLIHRAAWVIRDGSRKVRTGCAASDREGAERNLADYIARKYQAPRESGRAPAQILVLDVLNIYASDAVPKHKRPNETMQRLLTLGDFPGWHALADVNGKQCRAYVAWRMAQPWKSSRPDQTGHPARMVSAAAARRELEDLRAAINHHRKEGLCSEVVGVALPDKGEPRDAWLTRDQAARLLWAAWRAKQVMQGTHTKRDVGRHLARFILTGLYTGTRHAAICGAAFQPAIGRGHVDLDRGVFSPEGARRTRNQKASAACAPAKPIACAPAALAPARHRQACGRRVERQAGVAPCVRRSRPPSSGPGSSNTSPRTSCGTRRRRGRCRTVATSGRSRASLA